MYHPARAAHRERFRKSTAEVRTWLGHYGLLLVLLLSGLPIEEFYFACMLAIVAVVWGVWWIFASRARSG